MSDEGFKKNRVKLSYAARLDAVRVEENLGIFKNPLYNLLRILTSNITKTKYTTLHEEVQGLRREPAEV